MYRTKLARTLLVLGLAACERADDRITRTPLVGDDDRPAVGNIGQTGARAPLVDPGGSPAVGNIGQTGAPLADTHGSPAVGNIGQTGRPAPREIEHVSTSMRLPSVRTTQPPVRRRATVRTPLEIQVPSTATIEVKRPRVDAEERPAVGNMGRAAPEERISTGREHVPALEPIVTAKHRPAVGNIPKKKLGKTPPEDERLTTGREPIQALEPLEDRRRRPAVGNTPSKKAPRR